jgi:integrase
MSNSMEKPSKPWPDFPLTPHASGKWRKKIRGHSYYFGRWEDPHGALEEYEQKKHYLMAGIPVPKSEDSYTVAQLSNEFYASREQRHAVGKIRQRALSDYYKTCKRLVSFLGKTRAVETLGPGDFDRLMVSFSGRNWNLVTIGNEIRRIRAIFNWAYKTERLDRPVRFGAEFAPPSRSDLRKLRNAAPPRELSAEELRTLINTASTPLKAFILLGMNGGFGQMDIATIESRHLKLNENRIAFPRSKTGIDRGFPLWPETRQAIEEAIAARPTPRKGYEKLLFVTRNGLPWVKDNPSGTRSDAVIQAFTKLKARCKIKGRNKGFYAIRHVFRTVADEVKDQPAIFHIMGHGDGSIAGVYRERISPERLKAVTDYVHDWLFPPEKPKTKRKSSK